MPRPPSRPGSPTAPPSGGLWISKSKFLSGLQCPKLLWHTHNRKGDLKAAWQWLEKAMDNGGDKIKLVALDDPERELLWVGISEV